MRAVKLERLIHVFSIVLAAAVAVGLVAQGFLFWAGACGVAALIWSASLWGLVGAERLADRVRRGCCPACGYDLRQTPHRCPECGHVPPHGVQLEFRDWLAAEFGQLV